MKLLGIPLLLLAASTASFADLTADQKLADFRQLIGLFDKRYAPYEWKKQLFQYDLLDAQPWLDRVAQSQTDLDYYEICVEYIAGLHDGNSVFVLPSDFRARLGFAVNMVQGQAFISSIDRRLLPASTYPFDLGDVLVSLDGKTPAEWIAALAKYIPAGSQRVAQQIGATFITDRVQQLMPHAVDVGETADVRILRATTGSTVRYTIPWTKTGMPLAAGPVPSAKSAPAPPQEDTPAPTGVLLPFYRLPDGFVQRLGRTSSDFFLSGTFTASGHNIGYLRIGGFNSTAAPVLAQLNAELTYLQQNTDGLVLDAWGMGGSNQCAAEEIAARFLSAPFETVGYSLRATRDWVQFFESRLNLSPTDARDEAQANLDKVVSAYQQSRGLTEPLPLCGNTLTHAPSVNPYTKAVLVLVNELTNGPAEFLAAMLQDTSRAVLFGGTTAGAGTISNGYSVGSYAEGVAVVPVALAVRPKQISVEGFPPTHLIENIGVRPDVTYDVFTLENVPTLGGPYVTAFTRTLVDRIEAK